jgi:thiamine-phosphate pyrophosphorylase
MLHFYPNVVLRLGHPYAHLPLSVWEKLSQTERQELRENCIQIGTSIHSVEQLRQAEEMGADYVTAGHIFSTACKADLPPRGLSFLKEICGQAKIPVYGIGGIHRENEKAVIRQGAAGVCVMSACMRE